MVLQVDCEKQTANNRFVHRARESSDSPDKFEKRYEQYKVKNPGILKHYESLLATVCIGAGVLGAEADYA